MATKPTEDKPATGLTSFAAFDLAQKLLVAACGPVPNLVLIPSAKGGSIKLAASLNGSEAMITVVGGIAGLTEPIEVPADNFLSALKGRKEGTMKLKDGTLFIKSGTYEATVNTTESNGMEAINIPEGEDVQQFTVTPDLHQFLSSKLPQIRIERVHSALPDVMLNIRAGKKSRYIAAYDAHQLCFLTTKVKTDEEVETFNLCLPYTRFASFIKDLPVANCKVYITSSAMTAVSKQFRVQMALPHIEPGTFADPDSVYEKAKQSLDLKGDAFSIQAPQLQGFLENSRSLIAIGTQVSFAPDKAGTAISVASQHGTTKLVVKGTKVPTSFGLDHRFVQTLLSKQSGSGGKKPAEGEDTVTEITFELVENTFVLCRSSVTYLALLNAAPQGSEEAKDD